MSTASNANRSATPNEPRLRSGYLACASLIALLSIPIFDRPDNTARLVLPALNEMIDLTTARTVALLTRLPMLMRN